MGLRETRFVHLQRRDVLAQGVSWARAEQTGHWQDRDGTTPCPGPQFDFDEVDRYVKAVNEHNAAWREWFASSTITPLVVFYEGLVADMPRTTATVLRFLGLEVPVTRSSPVPDGRPTRSTVSGSNAIAPTTLLGHNQLRSRPARDAA